MNINSEQSAIRHQRSTETVTGAFLGTSKVSPPEIRTNLL